MKEKLKSIVIRTLVYFMISIVGVLIANNAIFIHSHKMADGTFVTHAHPFHKAGDSKPFKSHHHTQADFLFLENLEILFFSGLLILLSMSFSGQEKHIVYIHTNYISAAIISQKGRAPPFL